MNTFEDEASRMIESYDDLYGNDVQNERLVTIAALSTAISLKRIADALTLTPKELDQQQAPANIRSLLCELVDNTRGGP